MPLAFRHTLARRLAVVAAPLLLGAALPRPAAAQVIGITLPTCGTATLAQYLALVGCTAGGAVFANFSGSLATYYTAPTDRTLGDVLVQPLAVGNTMTFAFTIGPSLTIAADAATPMSPNPFGTLSIGFDVFGWPSRPGGSAYLPLLPLAIGNALDADPAFEARVHGTLLTTDGVRATFRSSALEPTCIDYSLGAVVVLCRADPRGLVVDFDGGHVALALTGGVERTATAAAGAGASATIRTIAVGFELPPLPPDPPVTTTTPEPGTWALLATGLVGLLGTARRRRADRR